MSLLDKLLNVGSVSGASVMSQSKFFNEKEMVQTDLPILNVAYSGDLDGGFTPGITITSGDSKTFKSMLGLYCLRSYLKKYPEAIGIIYDSEYGISLENLKAFGIDPSRIIHIPVEHIEQLKFDFVKKLDTIKQGDKVFFMIDSLGQLASKKETDDAIDEKSVADMTRAKAIRSLFRLVTIQLVKKELPCYVINHVYSEVGAMYPQTIIPGGKAVVYSANTVFVITKSQEKDSGGELSGWNFNLSIYKSRTVKEKARFSIQVMYDEGMNVFSGILDLALESGHIIKPKNGWYQMVNVDTGEVIDGNYRAAATQTPEVLGKIMKTQSFKDFIKKKYKLGAMQVIQQINEEEEDSDEIA